MPTNHWLIIAGTHTFHVTTNPRGTVIAADPIAAQFIGHDISEVIGHFNPEHYEITPIEVK